MIYSVSEWMKRPPLRIFPLEARAAAHWLGAQAALAEGPGLVPRSYITWFMVTWNSSSWGLLWHWFWGHLCMCACTRAHVACMYVYTWNQPLLSSPVSARRYVQLSDIIREFLNVLFISVRPLEVFQSHHSQPCGLLCFCFSHWSSALSRGCTTQVVRLFTGEIVDSWLVQELRLS